jgi:divalent metal cation (Fe/Co/Zn/Cd) transporter
MVGAAVLFVDMFFTWQGVNLLGTTIGVSGWHGLLGVILGLVTLALLAWEVVLMVGERAAEVRSKVPFQDEKLISTALAAGVLVVAVLKFLSANELRRWPEWVALVVALVIGYGGWLVYSGQDTVPAEAPSPT